MNWGTYAPDKGDWDIEGDLGTVYFQFTNSQTGEMHDAWAGVETSTDQQGNYQAAITAIHIETGTAAVPEPSSMALLCLGAAGVTAMRRRNRTAV